MGTYLRLALDKRRKKSDNTFPIVFKITHNRIPTTLKTNYSVEEAFWDKKALLIKKGSKVVKFVSRVNLILKGKEINMIRLIMELDDSNQLESMSVSELVTKLKQSDVSDKITFVSYTNQIITNLKHNNKIGNAFAYQNTLVFFTKYSNLTDITFSEITSKFLKTLESNYMSQPNNHYNGLSVYMRTIRAIYNRAIADGFVNIQSYPFKQRAGDSHKYQIKNEKTRKRAISKEHIRLIENYEPESGTSHFLTDAKMFFLFSFYMRGINFIDISQMRVKNINNGSLIFKRSKTSRIYEIKLNTKALAILEYYGLKRKKANDFLFPIIKHAGNYERILMDIKNTTKNINKYLKVIAKSVGIDINLTMYVSRHSWATIADKAGVDRRIISKGLGHTDLKTTEIYIDDLVSTDDLEAADELITG